MTTTIAQDFISTWPGLVAGLLCAVFGIVAGEWWKHRTYRHAFARLAHLAPPVQQRTIREDYQLHARANAGLWLFLALAVCSSFVVLTMVYGHIIFRPALP